jgi:glycine dehydrogenase
MIAIRREIADVEAGRAPREGNVLKHAPHTAEVVTSDTWDRSYGRAMAAFPAPWLRGHKFWPAVSRLNNVLGDRQLMCTCPPVGEYS